MNEDKIVKSEKILVCDDNEEMLRTMCKALEEQGYQVTDTSCGKDAIEEIKNGYYELVILDIRMPDMDGIQVMEQIREIQTEKSSNIIIVTGYASEDTPIKALRLGAADYIMKPFELDEFIHSIEQNMKLIRATKDKEFFFDKMVEKSNELKLTKQELAKLRIDVDSENKTD